ncbi:MAG: toast rack family protein [Trueperaceae bacterium]
MSDPERSNPASSGSAAPPPAPPSPPPRGGGAPVWAYALIGVGALMLLVNAGWIRGIDVLSILNLWPVALLAVGADLLTKGGYRLPIVAGAIVLGAVLLMGGGFGTRGTGETVAVEHGLDGARAAEVVLRLGVGSVEVHADAPAGRLLAGTVVTARGEQLDQVAGRRGDVARIELTVRQQSGTSISSNARRSWDLGLTREVPVDLRVDAGVGDVRFDLRDATLSGLDLSGGVGEIDVVLPARGGYVGRLDLGVGEASVELPEGVEAHLTISVGLGGADVEGDWLRDGREYTTPGYAQAAAEDRIELTISGGIGGVEVERD